MRRDSQLPTPNSQLSRAGRDRGTALILVLVLMMALALLLGAGTGHYMQTQAVLRRHDASEGSVHAARGAVRWAQGVVEREPAFSGTMRRAHELGTITVTVDARAIRAELRGRKVTYDRASSAWRED